MKNAALFWRGGLSLILLLSAQVVGAFPIFNSNLNPNIVHHRHAWSLQGGFLLPDASWRKLSTEVNEEEFVTRAYYWQTRWEYSISHDWVIRLGGEWQEIYNDNLHFIGIFVGGDIVDVLYAKLRHRFYGVFTLGFAPYTEFFFRHPSIAPPQEFDRRGTGYQIKFAFEYEYRWLPTWYWRATLGYFYEVPLGIEDTPKVSVKDLTIQGPYAGINLVWRPQ